MSENDKNLFIKKIFYSAMWVMCDDKFAFFQHALN